MDATVNANTCLVSLGNGASMRIEVLGPQAFRIRLRQDNTFREPALVRYGILNVQADSGTTIEIIEAPGQLVVATAEATVSVDTVCGTMALTRADGTLLTHDVTPPWSDSARGFGATLSLADGERLYGLGDVTRERIQKRGLRSMMWVRNVESYVPIPCVMSSRGWGLLLNTTWRHFFDLGAANPGELRFWGTQGELDYVLFVGDDLPALLDVYTNIAGKPALLPLWGYGLTFVSNEQANAREMLDDCLNLRREAIPCDLIGLEPGWMSKHYDYSVEKAWHPERFYIPPWAPKGPQTFLGAADRLGFKMSLWLCCDYDLSFEAERRAGVAGYAPPEDRAQHADDFELDYHQHLPVMMDQLTRPEEAWFEHLKPFVDQGVSAFKMDGARQVNEHPDRRWGNGMGDEEMHNLYPVLLNQQMAEGFSVHTGRRPMIYSSGGYMGIQQFAATWAGDTGGGPKPLISMLNHGLSGHSNASCDMDVFTPAGIHFGFLQPWSQVCSWAYWRHPWLLGDKLLPLFKSYARLRYRLLPYLYAMAHRAATSGLPMMRAMALAFPDDPQSDDLLQQYMLGDALLVAAFTEHVHLPEGVWFDLWTGERFEGPQDLDYALPGTRPDGLVPGGPLFVRAGSIIPTWPVMDYVGQKPVTEVGLQIYPDLVTQQVTRFVLYEDDGETLAYLDGAAAEAEITVTVDPGQMRLVVGPRRGAYAGMLAARTYEVSIHGVPGPAGVLVEGAAESTGVWVYDAALRILRISLSEDPQRQAPRTVVLRW